MENPPNQMPQPGSIITTKVLRHNNARFLVLDPERLMAVAMKVKANPKQYYPVAYLESGKVFYFTAENSHNVEMVYDAAEPATK